MKPYLRNSILATLIYYDIFDYPLTAQEVYDYLINPARISNVAGIGKPGRDEIKKELNSLQDLGFVGAGDGFFFLSNRDHICDLRKRRRVIAGKKWRRFLKIIPYLMPVPYLRGVFVSGSMATDNTDEKSDFDVLIIAKSGRLYTCRLFLWLLSSLMMVRRKKHEKVAPDKLCFNHYITDNSLHLVHESLFNAQTYVNLKPVIIPAGLMGKFFVSNTWLNKFVFNFKPQNIYTGRILKPKKFYQIIAGALEAVLNSFFGDWLEKASRNIQQNKIRKNPLTFEGGGRVVWNDRELEFHPHSFEAEVISRYNQGLKKAGITPYITEVDSGLTP